MRAWYARHARDLPWRATRDPYAIWVSEIMLQQTQVTTVRPYFQRFLAALPTIQSLAEADIQQVLRLWEGLGYYRRARQLYEAARVIVDQHAGQFPNDLQVVRRLPGIGRYTAGAVLSIAFDTRAPILEANTTRLFARLLAYEGDTASRVGQKLLWGLAEAVLPGRAVGQFNQALMELGSQACLPRRPACERCPVQSLCAARAAGRETEIPRPKAKLVFEHVREAAVLVRRGQSVLLVQCPEGGRWAGLWDFPRFALEAEQAAAISDELAAKVEAATGVVVRIGPQKTTLRHGVTRYRITLEAYGAAYVRQAATKTHARELRWLHPNELRQYPLSATGRRLAKLL